ncbi:uncharacterized protein PG998_001080 [Apiospora kogelbergensis]|uniref:Uncharacterized protein n=1 Tax=Apiospora kogelbergensis TaxID=1337665 RepID=A0AAW0QVE9_9PEZI
MSGTSNNNENTGSSDGPAPIAASSSQAEMAQAFKDLARYVLAPPSFAPPVSHRNPPSCALHSSDFPMAKYHWQDAPPKSPYGLLHLRGLGV